MSPEGKVRAFVALELVSNNVVEPWVYGSKSGLSTVAVLLAAVALTACGAPATPAVQDPDAGGQAAPATAVGAQATAGSGDVLTGLIAARLAQGDDPAFAAQVAVHLHGLAGDLAVAAGRIALAAGLPPDQATRTGMPPPPPA